MGNVLRRFAILVVLPGLILLGFGLRTGPNFTGERLHNTGVAWRDGKFSDPGAGQGNFKTPTLREIARTAPYMHNGGIATLEDVIEYHQTS